MFFRKLCTAIVSIVLLVSATWSFAQRGTASTRSAAPEDVLPAEDCIVFWSCDGLEGKTDLWQQTALYESMIDSGLAESVESYIRGLLEAQGVSDPEAEKAVRDLIQHVRMYGGGIAAYPNASNLEDPPEIVVAIGNGEEFGEKFQTLLQLDSARGTPMKDLKMEQDGDRTTVTLEDINLTAWIQDGLLLLTGPDKFADAIETRIGGADAMIRSHANYPAGDTSSRGFVDATSLFAKIDEGLGPHPKTGVRFSEVLKDLGVDGLQGMNFSTSFNGPAIDSQTNVLIDPNNRGLFDSLVSNTMSFDDMPPLPDNVTAFSFTRCDLSGFAKELLTRIRKIEERVGETGEVDKALAEAEEEMGVSPLELIAGFGDILGIYDQTDAGLLAPPVVAVASVKDRDLIKTVFRTLIEKSGVENEGDLTVQFAEEDTFDRVTISTGTPFSVSLGVSDKWAVIGMTPQYFTSFFDRVAEGDEGWRPDTELLERVPELSSPFHSVSYVDVAQTWKTGLSALPMAFGAIGNAMGAPVALPRMPRTRNITGPMFPNVTVMTKSETGFVSRSSMSAIPLPTTVSGGALSSPMMLGIGTALLLPAVQGARSAARRVSSQNNLKQIGLGLHNYHDVYRSFPSGTIAGSADDPQDRLSWLVEITPYLELDQVHRAIDKESPWDSPDNIEVAAAADTTVFENPNLELERTEEDIAVSSYAGCAGVGKGAALLPANNNKAGIFGLNRKSSIRDITDGTSNTLMVGEINKDRGAWTAGGKPTLREFTEEPYINGPDGFGGNSPGGSQFLLGDGSVRFLSEDLDPSIAEALMTQAGGEVIPQF